ncbi:MAG: hypothetical protein COW89_10285 [Nitrospinae bacterium CG22_combo_CG10-13_8_21_14_all_47_10]|nr:MAG: hypothetical protein COW89_10285 [Nitrospinae bacterium CG22_combo_CG10-13_8_21_14_all_47_10]
MLINDPLKIEINFFLEKPEKLDDEGRIDRSVVSVLMENFDRVNEVRVQAQDAQKSELLRFWKRNKEISKNHLESDQPSDSRN